jgi:hypothetical protein
MTTLIGEAIDQHHRPSVPKPYTSDTKKWTVYCRACGTVGIVYTDVIDRVTPGDLLQPCKKPTAPVGPPRREEQ